MTKFNGFAKGLLATAAGVAAISVAAASQAQTYPNSYSSYDPCQRDASNRGLKGALLGGAGGAVIGSQFAASGHRRDGSLLGGVVGALAGAAIGHSSAACNSTSLPPPPPVEAAPPPPPPAAYNDYPPAPPTGASYDGPPPPPLYAERETVWVYGRHGVRYRVVDEHFDRDGCTLAESPVYMPDGRVDRRFVRVCPDYRGRYRIVD